MSLGSFSMITNSDEDPITLSESVLTSILSAMLEDTFTDEDIAEALTESYDYEDIALEKSIVKLDRKAKKTRAYRVALMQVAKKEDPKNYEKMKSLRTMINFIWAKWEKKYDSKAKAYMRASQNKLRTSSSPTAKKALSKTSGTIVASKPSAPNTSKKLASSNKPHVKTYDKYESGRQNKYGVTNAKINSTINSGKSKHML